LDESVSRFPAAGFAAIIKKRRAKKNPWEVRMFQVSQKASEMIKEHFTDREKIPSIRIILSQGG
jgi:hypothetical protein